MVEALCDPNDRIQLAATEVLMRLGRPALQAVLPLTDDQRPHVRIGALNLVGVLVREERDREETKAVAKRVLRALQDEDAEVRRTAAWVAGSFPEESEEIVPSLIKALKDQDGVKRPGGWSVAHNAAFSLGRFGARASGAVPALKEATQAKDGQLKWAAFDSLAQIAAEDPSVLRTLVPWLVDILKDKMQGAQRDCAATTLSKIGPAAKDAVPALRDALRFDDIKDKKTAEEIRYSVLIALKEIGPAAEAAIPDLIAIVKNRELSTDERCTAADALSKIGPAAKTVITALTEIAKDESDPIQRTVSNLLKMLQR